MDKIFTDYLMETFHNIEQPFSTFKWLIYLDNDSLNMLVKSTDNFSAKITDEEVDEDVALDIFNLVDKLVEFEIAGSELNKTTNDHIECIQSFVGMVNIVSLFKKGMVNISGDGKITTNDTRIFITEKGKDLQNLIGKGN